MAEVSVNSSQPALRVGGFSYVGVLILLALLSLTAAATLGLGAVSERRAAEEELLRIGAEFEAALQSYSSAGGRRFPASLEELVKDQRFALPRRHLRQIYVDPLTGQATWGVVELPGHGVVGIYSLADDVPIKRAGFAAPFERFEDAASYREWLFGAAVVDRGRFLLRVRSGRAADLVEWRALQRVHGFAVGAVNGLDVRTTTGLSIVVASSTVDDCTHENGCGASRTAHKGLSSSTPLRSAR